MTTTPSTVSAPLSGRRAQAARNDEAILAAARAVYLDNPDAPISAVAERAGVGISALYRRFPSKEELLRKLCADGLAAYIDAVRGALDSLSEGTDAWEALTGFFRSAVDAGSASLTTRLAGTFAPSEDLYRAATLADELNQQLVERVRAAGVIRRDVEVADLGLILEQIAAVRIGDEGRTNQLRHRYLTLMLDGLRPAATTELPGPPPAPAELAARWRV
ncbi:MAG TPA: helix-turn-helix domain-containing protein [Nocardioidaceae bacterium]|nr:helix-turn-helix domain-containing protein [Nocardioidaceae bacterium]